MTKDWPDYHRAMGLRPLINVSGTMTSLGASIVVPEARAAITEVLPQFVSIHELQGKASKAIASLTGAEAGCITASSSSGITLAIAAAMTGADPAKVQRLPNSAGMKNDVAIMMGHLCDYGAPIDQAIRLAGARLVTVGQSTQALDHQLTAPWAGRPPQRFSSCRTMSSTTARSRSWLCRDLPPARGPGDRRRRRRIRPDRLSRSGADIAIYSAHKFLGGPTAGIVAGAKELVRATYLQNIGIGRGMKVGKEGIAGAIAALEAWATRDHAAIRARQAPRFRSGAPPWKTGRGSSRRSCPIRPAIRSTGFRCLSIRSKPAPVPAPSPPRSGQAILR